MSRPIAILGGTGPAGMGLGLRWARAGEIVIIGSRDGARAQNAVAEIKKKAGDAARGCIRCDAVLPQHYFRLAWPIRWLCDFLRPARPQC